MSEPKPVCVLVMSSTDPGSVRRLIDRIHREVPEARVGGVLYERRPPKTATQRVRNFLKNLHDRNYVWYATGRIGAAAARPLIGLGRRILRFVHAGRPNPNGSLHFDLDDLAAYCASVDCALHVTPDTHAETALAFARGLEPDLGLVYGTRILKPDLFEIPRQGSINIHKRKVPDYRGGGPVGLWELLDDQPEIGVTVHRVVREVDAGAVLRTATIPIEPFDDLTSLGLKADVVGNDLLVAAVADHARGTVRESPQAGEGRMFRSPKPQLLAEYQRQLRARRSRYRRAVGRPLWKLAPRILLLFTFGAVRNWYRRLRGAFPVMMVYHHVITDRPHPLGMSTGAFHRQIEYLRRNYRIVSIDDAIRMLEAGRVDSPTVVLTLDDGYADNYVNLRAVTQALDVPVTLFVCSEHVLSGRGFKHDLDIGVDGFAPLDADQVRHLDRSGLVIGSHTRTHFDCGSTDEAQLHSEIIQSRKELEEMLGRSVPIFSFPFGHRVNISEPAFHLARETYTHIFSAYGGENRPNPAGDWRHLLRGSHPDSLLELELLLQSVLEF